MKRLSFLSLLGENVKKLLEIPHNHLSSCGGLLAIIRGGGARGIATDIIYHICFLWGKEAMDVHLVTTFRIGYQVMGV